MPDQPYKEYAFLLQSRGIEARPADDTLSPQSYLNLDNCEELAENAFGTRLGTIINNKTGSSVDALEGIVNTVSKLGGLNGQAWRYAATSAGNLYRRTGLTVGTYVELATTYSGNPMWMVPYRPDISSYPYMFGADTNGMWKDNGSLVTPQQMGIFQPAYPVQAQAQAPDEIILDNFTGSVGDYTFSGIGPGAIVAYVNTTAASAITAPGVFELWVADTTQPGLFQLLTINKGGGNEETVLVLEVTAKGFIAEFTKAHVFGETVTSVALQSVVPASTTATISKSFGGTPISGFPTTLSLSDYIGLYVYVSDPTQVQSITIKFDCGDGSFNTDYFWKVIAQGPLQQLLNTVNEPTTSATDALLSDTLGLFGNSQSGVAPLNTGLNVWTAILQQLSDFAGSGRADFNDPVYNWQNVNGYQITIVTNDQTSATIELAALVLFGGAGPDTLGGVAYDYAVTFYNANDGSESNPSMFMSNVNPPNDTNWVYPRRQPVLLTLKMLSAFGLDSQCTHVRIYRRGGTLGDNFRRVDEVPLTVTPPTYSMTYLDVSSDADISAGDILSLTNDVPLTSALPVPVNTTLSAAIPSTNQNANVYPVSMANISVGQLVEIGNPTDPANNFETVIVLTILTDHFVAFVQNSHAIGEPVQATAQVGKTCTIMALAFNQFWFAGDSFNPSTLYWSTRYNPQAVGAANSIEISSPDDIITAVVPFKGNLYVSTLKAWWVIAPGTNDNASPTVYPTAAKHGCVAPFGFIVTEEGIYYQAIDGIRFFAGGASQYLTQGLEFIFQGVGTTPIVEADPTQLSKTVGAYWNNMLFFSYVGLDGNRHRVIVHTEYKRWRNDDIDVQSIFLEADTNTLVFGDSNGLVRIDRQDIGYDEGNNAGALIQNPIPINLETGFNFMGMPDIEKQYNEFTIDCNTGGQAATITLIFNDGEFSQTLGTVSTTERQKVNFNISLGKGVKAYKVAMQITGSFTSQPYFYQASIKALPLAKTRQSIDTFQLRLGTDESKICKQVYWEYTSTDNIEFSVYYDDNPIPSFVFTLPDSNGIRTSYRQRLPAISFRLIRFVGTCDVDFYIWEESKCEFKPQCSGKGYQSVQFVPN